MLYTLYKESRIFYFLISHNRTHSKLHTVDTKLMKFRNEAAERTIYLMHGNWNLPLRNLSL